jgi:hypothetical protein
MQPHFPQKSETGKFNRQQRFVKLRAASQAATRQMPLSCLLTTHWFAAGVQPLFDASTT